MSTFSLIIPPIVGTDVNNYGQSVIIREYGQSNTGFSLGVACALLEETVLSSLGIYASLHPGCDVLGKRPGQGKISPQQLRWLC